MPSANRYRSPTPTRRRARTPENRGRSRTRTRDNAEHHHREDRHSTRQEHRSKDNRHRTSPTTTRTTSRDQQHHTDNTDHHNKHKSDRRRTTRDNDADSPGQLQRHYQATLDNATIRTDRHKRRHSPADHNAELPIAGSSSMRTHRSSRYDRYHSRSRTPKTTRNTDKYKNANGSPHRRHTSPSPNRTPEHRQPPPPAPAPPTISSFRQDKHHYDTNEVAHLNFPKRIKTTDHSITNGTAKRDPHDIYLWELLYNKNENWALRYLAHGRYTALEVTKSFKESVFIQELLRNIRGYKLANGQDGPTPVDLDQIATDYARNHDMPFKSGIEKKAVYTIIAKQTYEFLHNKMPSVVTNDMQKRMKDLEQENAALRANSKPILQALGARNSSTTTTTAEPIELERGSRDKIMATIAPAGQKPADIDNWIKNMKLNSAQQKQVLKLSTDIQAHISTMDDAVAMEHLRAVLCDWGLSITLAAKIKTSPTLVKMLAVVIAKTQ